MKKLRIIKHTSHISQPVIIVLWCKITKLATIIHPAYTMWLPDQNPNSYPSKVTAEVWFTTIYAKNKITPA